MGSLKAQAMHIPMCDGLIGFSIEYETLLPL